MSDKSYMEEQIFKILINSVMKRQKQLKFFPNIAHHFCSSLTLSRHQFYVLGVSIRPTTGLLCSRSLSRF